MARTALATIANRAAKSKNSLRNIKIVAFNATYSLDDSKYDLHWKAIENLTCNAKDTLPEASPAFPSSNLQLLLLHLAPLKSHCVFLILILSQNLAGDDLHCQF